MSPRVYPFSKMAVKWSPKFNLHHLPKGFKMAVLTPKLGIGNTSKTVLSSWSKEITKTESNLIDPLICEYVSKLLGLENQLSTKVENHAVYKKTRCSEQVITCKESKSTYERKNWIKLKQPWTRAYSFCDKNASKVTINCLG